MNKTLLIAALVAASLFTACQRTSVAPTNGDGQEVLAITESKSDADTKDWDKKEGKDDIDKTKSDCFKLVYPLTLKVSDGSYITVKDEKEMITAKKKIASAKLKVVLKYPVKINWGGKIYIIKSEKEMYAAKMKCKKKVYKQKIGIKYKKGKGIYKK